MATALSTCASPERRAGLVALFALIAALATPACGGDATGAGTEAALGPVTATSSSGALALTVTMEPDPPLVGTNAAVIELRRAADQAPEDGRALEVVPWMPAHGHGASVRPTVEALGEGRYRATNVVFFMAGRWELRATIGEGDAADHAVAIVEVR